MLGVLVHFHLVSLYSYFIGLIHKLLHGHKEVSIHEVPHDHKKELASFVLIVVIALNTNFQFSNEHAVAKLRQTGSATSTLHTQLQICPS